MTQIVLDTETTGLDPNQGHRIIEVGCIKLINRQLVDDNYQQYIHPARSIDPGAAQVHGITEEFLADKPRFRDIIENLIEYLRGSELIIHNAKFDVGFLNHEFAMAGKKYGKITNYCKVFDTLTLARKLHPGQKNNLDALCKRYQVDNTQRDLHGALLDSQILAQVYLAMTSGQDSFTFKDTQQTPTHEQPPEYLDLPQKIKVVKANQEELKQHKNTLEKINGQCEWQD